jgi:hypothetical protein
MAGAFNAEGEWQGTVGKTAEGLPITVNLQLELTGANEIAGTILAGSVTESATVLRDAYRKTAPAPEKPAYTMTLTGIGSTLPQGTGYAAITVDQSGNVRATGRLGDDTVYSFSSVVSPFGTWPFYSSLYNSTGYMGGTLTFAAPGQKSVGGTLHWLRPATNGFGGYSAGFQGGVTAAGYEYTAPARNMAAIPLNGEHQGLITFSGLILSSTISEPVSLGPTGALSVSGTSGIKLSLTPATGVFSGTVDAGFSKRLSFYGVLLQNLDEGAGLFQSPTVSGDVEITSP